jgi:hypothetical protein
MRYKCVVNGCLVDLRPCQSTNGEVNVFFRPFDLTFHETINETLSIEKMPSVLQSILHNEWCLESIDVVYTRTRSHMEKA